MPAGGAIERMTVMPRESRDWTVDDLDLLPDDGLHYELLDRMLLVTPAPIPVHQRVTRKLFELLIDVCPAEMEISVAQMALCFPVSVVPGTLVVR